MAWLDARCTADNPVVRRSELMDFRIDGLSLALLDQNRGIRRPAILPAALSILTTYPPRLRDTPLERRYESLRKTA